MFRWLFRNFWIFWLIFHLFESFFIVYWVYFLDNSNNAQKENSQILKNVCFVSFWLLDKTFYMIEQIDRVVCWVRSLWKHAFSVQIIYSQKNGLKLWLGDIISLEVSIVKLKVFDFSVRRVFCRVEKITETYHQIVHVLGMVYII